MGKLFDKLSKDCRVIEGLKACMNCGACVAVCPAAEFYRYSPKEIVNIVQRKDDAEIETLLKSDTIWYCGECMSCMTRCPRKNSPGMLIMALRSLSIDEGYFMYSEKGRQQYIIIKNMGRNILDYGYCVYPRTFPYEKHREYGLIGKWVNENLEAVHERLGSNLDGDGNGGLRKIPRESLDELQRIFDVTGATERMEKVSAWAKEKAEELGMTLEEYEQMTFTYDSGCHINDR